MLLLDISIFVDRFLDIIPFDLQVSSVEIGSTCYEAYLHDALRKVRIVVK